MSTYKLTPTVHKQMLLCSDTYKKTSARLALSLAYHAGVIGDIIVGMVMLSMLIEDGVVLIDGDETPFVPRDMSGEFPFDIEDLALTAVEYNFLTARNSVF